MNAQFSNLVQQLEAVFARHPQVGDEDMRVEGIDEF